MKYTKKLTLDEIAAARKQAESQADFEDVNGFWKYPMRKTPKRPRFECAAVPRAVPLESSTYNKRVLAGRYMDHEAFDWSPGVQPYKGENPLRAAWWRVFLASKLPKPLTVERLLEQIAVQHENGIMNKQDFREMADLIVVLSKTPDQEAAALTRLEEIQAIV